MSYSQVKRQGKAHSDVDKCSQGFVMVPDKDELKIRLQYNQIRKLVHELNQISPDCVEEKKVLLAKIINSLGERTEIVTPVWFDLGNVSIGENCFINHNCKFLDHGGVDIGNNVAFSVGVTVIAVGHPVNPLTIEKWIDLPLPVKIEDDVWIGANATLLGPITIGKGAVVGAGAVVVKDVEPYTVVAGNPAKVIKRLA